VYALIFALLVNTTGNNMKSLQDTISSLAKEQQFTSGIAFKDLGSGETVCCSCDEKFHTASMMKVFVMMYAYHQADSGKLQLNEPVDVQNEFASIFDGSKFSVSKNDDGDTTLYAKIGDKVPFTDLMRLMIDRSSNLATDILVEKLGAKNITEFAKSFGCTGTEILRGVEDMKAFEAGMNDMTTPHDMMMAFEQILNTHLFSRVSSDAMIQILLSQEFNDMLPLGVPKEVKIAHKTGSITGVEHDGGIFFLPDGRKYVLVVFTKGLTNQGEGREFGAKISKLVFNYESK